MIQLTSILSRFGHVSVYTNHKRNLIYAVPEGYISPTLLKKDLSFMVAFDAGRKSSWTYVVNISNVKFIHPSNPFLLKKLRDLSKMKEYIVYAPSPLVRLMLKSSRWISQPDRIIKDNDELQLLLKNS